MLDHITVSARSLEDGVRYVSDALGVKVPKGGSHPLMGTHNHIMRLGAGEFLEIIARDPTTNAERPRWFGLDDPKILSQLERSPRLSTWVCRVPDLAGALTDWREHNAEAVKVARGDLRWLISVPPDGSMPFSGTFPTLIQWPDGPHPSTKMLHLGCSLQKFEIFHPEADRITEMLSELGWDDPRVQIVSGPIGLSATILTPHGVRTLS